MAPGRGGEDRRRVGGGKEEGEGEEKNRNSGLREGEYKMGKLREKGGQAMVTTGGGGGWRRKGKGREI